MIKNTYDRILDEFEMNFPKLANLAVDWHPSGRSEITVKLRDGNMVTYDSTSRTLRNIRYSKDGDQMSESDWRKEFGFRLGSIMRTKGFNQLTLSDATGVSRLSISNYMHGRSLPSVYTLGILARALECSISELMDFN